jgi:hypothetical protein
VSRFYEGHDLRLSYVTWQEAVNPFVVVELLSLGTEKEDLGRSLRDASQPPNKWSVYEQILRIPYYFVFNRYTDEFQAFGLMMSEYQPLEPDGLGVWLKEAELGLGLWQGGYQGVERLWLRWYDRDGVWLPTPTDLAAQQAAQEKQRAELASQRVERLAAQLRALGVEPEK